MKKRFVVLCLAAFSLAALSGCYAVALTGTTAAVALGGATGLAPGPQNDMVENEWRDQRRHPVVVDKNWQYRGEWWEHTQTPDERAAQVRAQEAEEHEDD